VVGAAPAGAPCMVMGSIGILVLWQIFEARIMSMLVLALCWYLTLLSIKPEVGSSGVPHSDGANW
jgi:hypothetical protein